MATDGYEYSTTERCNAAQQPWLIMYSSTTPMLSSELNRPKWNFHKVVKNNVETKSPLLCVVCVCVCVWEDVSDQA